MTLDLRTGDLTRDRDDQPEIGGSTAGEVEKLGGLASLRELTAAARTQRRHLEDALAKARAQHASVTKRRYRSEHGFARFLTSDAAGALNAELRSLEARIQSLEAAHRESRIAVTFAPQEVVRGAYSAVVRSFAALAASHQKWNLAPTAGSVDPARPEISALREKARALLQLRNGRNISFEGSALRFEGAHSGSILVYPGMVMTVSAQGSRDLLPLHDLRIDSTHVHVPEADIVPADAAVLRRGSDALKPYRTDPQRLHDYGLPICIYGRLAFRTQAALIGEFEFSNADAADEFAAAFRRFQEEMRGGASELNGKSER